ncbi:MAG: hypothetical protein ABSC03_03250 [Verrucomicrobiota bacterium]|jgi:uncharacterized iron-regulated membrane protein
MALLNEETNRWRFRAVAASALLLAGLIIAAQGIRALPEREPVTASRRVQRAQRDASEQIIAGAAASLAGAALLVIIIRSRRLAPLK